MKARLSEGESVVPVSLLGGVVDGHLVALDTTWEPNLTAMTVKPICSCGWVGTDHRSTKSESLATLHAQAEHRAHLRTVARSAS